MKKLLLKLFIVLCITTLVVCIREMLLQYVDNYSLSTLIMQCVFITPVAFGLMFSVYLSVCEYREEKKFKQNSKKGYVEI